MIQLSIVDEHLLFREMLSRILSETGVFSVMLESDSGMEFIQKMEESCTLPALVILDIQMRGMNGIDFVVMLRKKYPLLKIVMLSDRYHMYTIQLLNCIGVNGVISKGTDLSTLISALQKVMEDDFIVIGSSIDNHATNLSGKKETMFSGKGTLSNKQIQFLKLCASTGLSYKMIAAEMRISPNTVNRYREEVFRKLKINTRMDAAIFAIQAGLVSF